MSENEKTAVVLLSGGLDSTVLLHYLSRELGRETVHALSFDYGQRHARELECARWQALEAGVTEHPIVDLSSIGVFLKKGSALLAGGGPVPDLDDLGENERTQPPTYVPNRNMILLAIAAAYAETQHIQEVFYGAQAQDEYGYWDCTSLFLERINNLLVLNRKTPVVVRAPFMDMRKSDILKIGLRLGVDFTHTWTCYRGGERACGTCPTCVERLHAFQETGTGDPLPYQLR